MEKTVLIIDETAAWRERYCSELEAEGFHVLTAADSKEAIAYLENIKFDLIISELETPVGSGFENLNEYVKMRDDLKLVITSTHPELKNDFRTWIADAFIIKSDDLTDLKTTIKYLLFDEERLHQRLN
ncbi:MAG TPA: response regulator [bacterium]